MQSNDARILRGAAVPTACVGFAGVAVGAVTAGAEGALGAALGTVLVVAFFATGLYGLSKIGEKWPELLLGAGLLVYTTQVLVMLILLRVFRDATFMDGLVFGLTMLVCIITWLAAQSWANVRAKTLYVDPQQAKDPSAAEPGT